MLAPWIGGASAPSPSPTSGGKRSLLAFWIGGASGYVDVPIIPPDIGPIGGGSGGGGGYRLPTYVTQGSKPSRFNIPIIDHNEDDEEQIVIALLMQVAKTEFFQ